MVPLVDRFAILASRVLTDSSRVATDSVDFLQLKLLARGDHFVDFVLLRLSLV